MSLFEFCNVMMLTFFRNLRLTEFVTNTFYNNLKENNVTNIIMSSYCICFNYFSFPSTSSYKSDFQPVFFSDYPSIACGVVLDYSFL